MTMEIMDHKQRSFKAVIVALANCEVRIFRDKYLVNTIQTRDIVTGMRYGRFGREDSTLIMTTKGEGLMNFVYRCSRLWSIPCSEVKLYESEGNTQFDVISAHP